jgi:general secretion pathway protein F
VKGVDLYINVISVGEEIGDIRNAFRNVLDHLEFRANLLKEVRSAIAYPLFLVLMSVVTVLFVCGFILPKFAKIFSPQELAKLPAISKFTITTGKFINSHFPSLVMVLITAVALIVYTLTLPGMTTRLRQWAYSLPMISKFMLLSDLSNLFSSLASMLDGGVDISRALRLSTRVVGSRRLVALLEETNAEIKKGNRISRVWGGHDIIPEDVVSLVVVGENSARMGEIFSSLGRRYLEKFKVLIARVLSLLEPIIIVLLGFFIALIVVSIMLSVISLGDVTL